MTRLPSRPGKPGREERPDRPFTGYKLAHAVLSSDSARAGFAGLTLGATRVYGVVADAECVWNQRHTPPRRWCGCGFYCLHSLADARSLACATENRSALLIEVTASGQYIRYERGLRSGRQRVRAILDAQCACGRPGSALADAGSGLIGWRHLAPVCARCSAGRPSLSLTEFAGRLDGPVRVMAPLSAAPLVPPGSGAQAAPATGPRAAGSSGTDWPTAPMSGLVDSDPAASMGAPGPGYAVPGNRAPGNTGARNQVPPPRPAPPADTDSPFAVLSAEIALLHARLDDLQARLDRG